MSLAAHAASYFYLPGYGMAFFTFVWTVLFFLYIYLTPRFLPHLYLFWGHVAFEATVVIFWLTTFALLADYTRAWDAWSFGYWGGVGGMVNSTKAATAFAVLNWLLFCITLFVSVWLNKRHSTGHTTSHTSTHNAVVDGHSSTGGGFFSNLFSRKGRTADIEKNGTGHNGAGGAVNESGQPVELRDHDAGYNGSGGYGAPTAPGQTYQQTGDGYGQQQQRY